MSEEISKSDQRRVNNCDHYLKTKKVMQNNEVYKDLSIGEVYYIKHKGRNDEERYITNGWNGDEPSKFMVFHKDESFVFVKRIIASGKMGKEVVCLNTTYDVDSHWLEADPDFVNSILLENEDGYDPLAASKKISSNKNKARRRNKKLEIKFDDIYMAQSYLDGLKVGDLLHDADTSYGSGTLTWEVSKVEKRKTNKDKPTSGYYNNNSLGSTNEDRIHNEHGLRDLIVVTIKIKGDIPKSRQYEDKKKIVTFNNFIKSSYRVFYRNKPYTIDDV